ncbi:MAG: phosphoglycerate mutase, partial [Candidatus Omnitrophota bacterium]
FVVGTLLEEARQKRELRILVLPDHPTPMSVRTHTCEPVVFGIFGKDIVGGQPLNYSEREAEKSELYFEKGHELMGYFIK